MVILAYFAVIALAFFLLIVRPQRRRMSAHRALVEALTVGDEVVTTGGIFGTIRAVDDDKIELEVAPGVAITVARAAIAQSVNPVPPSTDPATTDPPAIDPADNGTNDD
jgi:preprotein translocase subunit YajC